MLVFYAYLLAQLRYETVRVSLRYPFEGRKSGTSSFICLRLSMVPAISFGAIIPPAHSFDSCQNRLGVGQAVPRAAA